MAHINDCVPGQDAKILRAGVPRVVGRVGRIIEVSRTKRTPDEPIQDKVTVDVKGHGSVVVAPADLEIVGGGR